MSIELSLTIIAICGILIVSFGAVAGIYLLHYLILLRKTTHSLELKITPIIEEAKKIVNFTSSTSERIKSHIESATPLLHSIEKVSDFIKEFPNQFKNNVHENTLTVNFEAKKENLNIGDWAEWVAQGITLIQRLRK